MYGSSIKYHAPSKRQEFARCQTEPIDVDVLLLISRRWHLDPPILYRMHLDGLHMIAPLASSFWMEILPQGYAYSLSKVQSYPPKLVTGDSGLSFEALWHNIATYA